MVESLVIAAMLATPFYLVFIRRQGVFFREARFTILSYWAIFLFGLLAATLAVNLLN